MKRRISRKNRKKIKQAALLLALLLCILPEARVFAAASAADTVMDEDPESQQSSTASETNASTAKSDETTSEKTDASQSATDMSAGSTNQTSEKSTGSSAPASSKVISDANAAKNAAEQSLNDVNSQIAGIQTRQTAIQNEMNELDAELTELLVNIAVLEGEIAAVQQELVDVTAQLGDAEEQAAKEYADMKLRIQYMYENSDGTLWEALLGAEDFSDMLNRLEYVESIYTYDRNLLTSYQQRVADVTDLRSAVLDTEEELQAIEAEYENQQAALTAAIEQKRAEKSDFDGKLASAQALAAEYSRTIAEQNEIIRQEQKRLEEEQKRKEAEAKAKAEAAARAKASASKNADASGAGSNTSSGSSGSSSASSDTSAAAGAAAPIQNPAYSSGVSGTDVVNYAMQFIGNPYVPGGTSLTDGCDCSGFTQSVYAHFGISLPRTSGSQALVGSAVSYEAAQPGDLVCYIGHVGIYIGGGQIVNASTVRTGIKTQSATYRSILTIRRVL